MADEHLERKQELVDRLTRRWSQPRTCPICASSSWQVDDGATVRADTGGAYPLFPVTCQTCGYVFFVNLAVAGAGDGEPPAPRSP